MREEGTRTGRLSGRIVSIRQNQGPPIKERQYGTKVKSGQSKGKEISSPFFLVEESRSKLLYESKDLKA